MKTVKAKPMSKLPGLTFDKIERTPGGGLKAWMTKEQAINTALMLQYLVATTSPKRAIFLEWLPPKD